MFKLHILVLALHASKIMLKILQARIQQYVNQEFPDVQSGFKKQRNQRSNYEHSLDHWESKGIPEKHLLLLHWLSFDCGSQKNCGKFFKRWEYQTTLPGSWEICAQVKKQQLESYMEQQTGS